MGGRRCIIIENAVLTYKTVPAAQNQCAELESQLRKLYANPEIAAAVAEDDTAVADQVCAALANHPLTHANLQLLLDSLPTYE